MIRRATPQRAILSAMFRLLVVGCACLMLVSQLACKAKSPASQPAVSELGIQDDASVNFDISALPASDGRQLWLATYASQGKMAKFEIELGPFNSPDSKSAPGFNFRFGKGAIKAVPGSDASVLLADLNRALDAKKALSKTQRASRLEFTCVIIGLNQSLVSGGGFADKPPGDWTAMKIFLPNGDEEAEVYLNFNSKAGKAQFSQKDSAYGDAVLQKLATVL
jgi:hypothetical protein